VNLLLFLMGNLQTENWKKTLCRVIRKVFFYYDRNVPKMVQNRVLLLHIFLLRIYYILWNQQRLDKNCMKISLI
jgi:hypothetical protein